ncbi:MAG TPA: adenosine deaminase family protein [Myxococcota bacterium]|nr:adenosine deaminase family protein [Myxococcota bacterium]
MYDGALLRALPKTDLHVHLDGSLRLGTLIELAAGRGVDLPSQTEEGLYELVFKESYGSLTEYLAGFAYTCAVLQDPEALERSAYELAWDNIDEGVRYVEVRFAPQLHMHGAFGYEEVLRAVNAGLDRARVEHEVIAAEKREPPFRYGIIVCALRYFDGTFSRWYAQLCDVLHESPKSRIYGVAALQLARAAVRLRDEEGLPIVAFDLAGHEAGYPADAYREAFVHAHEFFLKRTVHAGEAYGPESIYQAIADLNADRIGHGYHLFAADKIAAPKIKDREGYCEALAQYIADRRTTIEVCITSNLQTNPEIGSVENHAFRQMLDAKLSATLCTDNRLVSHTTVTREYELATQAFDMTPAQLRDTIIYGFKRSFYPGSYTEKRAYVRQIIDFYNETVSR